MKTRLCGRLKVLVTGGAGFLGSHLCERLLGFLFADRTEVTRSRIPLPDDRITLVHHNQGDENAYADLWLMTQIQHFIIANSTFSWWGAWLADYSEKHVIAPGFEMREGKMSWGFEGL